MSKKHEKVYRVLIYIDRSLIVISTISGCVSISAFASLFGISIGITSSVIELKVCAITAGIKKCKSMIKKRKKKHDKMVLLGKSKLSSIEVIVSLTLIDSNIIHDELILINNVLKEFYDTKEEIKTSNNK